MRMPNGEQAVVTDEKLFGFLLNTGHDEQAGHAVLFARLLGIDGSNAEVLRSALLSAAATGDATLGKRSPYGQKYEIRFSMTGPRGSFTILSIWMISRGGTTPRLVTAFVE